MQAVQDSRNRRVKDQTTVSVRVGPNKWFVLGTAAYLIQGAIARTITEFSWLDFPFYLTVIILALLNAHAVKITNDMYMVMMDQSDALNDQQRVLDRHSQFVADMHNTTIAALKQQHSLEHIGWGIQRSDRFELLDTPPGDAPPFGSEPLYRLPPASKATW